MTEPQQDAGGEDDAQAQHSASQISPHPAADGPSVNGEEDESAKKAEETNSISDDPSPSMEEEADSEDEDSQEDRTTTAQGLLGGEIDTPAFALLTGIRKGTGEGDQRVSVAVTRLPAILGRSHKTKGDVRNFFGLGRVKKMSRQQFTIYFQDASGGIVGQHEDDSNEFTYRRQAGASEDIIRSRSDPLPSMGFFVAKCLSKNSIRVGGKRVAEGEVALLTNRTTIEVYDCFLYFLLPTNAPTETIEVPPETTASGNKRKASPASASKPPKKTAAGSAGIAAELETLPLKVLLDRMSKAIESNQWERKHQMIGSAISLHAVQDAAKAPAIRELAEKDAGKAVARSDIMSWINAHRTYSKWVSQMLGRMELKSYQSNISKALVKAGFVRTGTTGRHVKWVLPEIEGSSSGDEDDSQEDSEESEGQEQGSVDDGAEVGGGVDEAGDTEEVESGKEEEEERQDEDDIQKSQEEIKPSDDALS